MYDTMVLSTKNKKPAGRRASILEMSTQAARMKADQLLAMKLSETAFYVLDRLFTSGVMSVSQLGIPLRTLQRYASADMRLLNRLPFGTDVVKSEFDAYGIGIEFGQATLYTLGPVGIEIVKMRYETTPGTGYMAYPLSRVMHDIVVNEIVQVISDACRAQGLRVLRAGKYEGSLFSEDGLTQLLEPDARIVIQNRDGTETQFCIEYHNKDKPARAWAKVDKYEIAQASNLWAEQWEIDQFPGLLFVFRDEHVVKGYAQKLTEFESPRVSHFGKRLDGVLSGAQPLEWMRVNDMQKVNILTGSKAAPAGEIIPQAGA